MESSIDSGETGRPPAYPAQDNAYARGYGGRKWLPTVIVCLLVCALAVLALMTADGRPQRDRLEGSSGVDALHGFIWEQGHNQDRLTGNIAKETGVRLMHEPFEIDAQIDIGPADNEQEQTTADDIMLGVDVKYDMKDLGARISYMGLGALEAYIIEDELIVSLLGRAGSVPIEWADTAALKDDLGLYDRGGALLPFLPQDTDFYSELLETAALCIPEKYTKAEKARVYSPKDGSDTEMDAITTTLNADAIIEVIKNFGDALEDNGALRGRVQRVIDAFADALGQSYKLTELLEQAAQPAVLEGYEIAWSVYSRQGRYTGVSLKVIGEDADYSYSYVSEFTEYENYVSEEAYVNGAGVKSIFKYTWLDNKAEISGEISTSGSPGKDGASSQISGMMEFVKEDSKEYSLTANLTVQGDALSRVFGVKDETPLVIGIRAYIKAGFGLETLKEDINWNGIYKKAWGTIEDVFGWLLPEGFVKAH